MPLPLTERPRTVEQDRRKRNLQSASLYSDLLTPTGSQ